MWTEAAVSPPVFSSRGSYHDSMFLNHCVLGKRCLLQPCPKLLLYLPQVETTRTHTHTQSFTLHFLFSQASFCVFFLFFVSISNVNGQVCKM